MGGGGRRRPSAGAPQPPSARSPSWRRPSAAAAPVRPRSPRADRRRRARFRAARHGGRRLRPGAAAASAATRTRVTSRKRTLLRSPRPEDRRLEGEQPTIGPLATARPGSGGQVRGRAGVLDHGHGVGAVAHPERDPQADVGLNLSGDRARRALRGKDEVDSEDRPWAARRTRPLTNSGTSSTRVRSSSTTTMRRGHRLDLPRSTTVRTPPGPGPPPQRASAHAGGARPAGRSEPWPRGGRRGR